MAKKLIYIPSESELTEENSEPSDIVVTHYHKLKKPGVFLLLSENDQLYKILYKGRECYVSKSQEYLVEEESS